MTADETATALTLLYVEDDILTQQDVELSLREAGYEVILASDGAEGLAILEAQAPHLKGLITDINLGDGPDGWDIARRARELVETMPVIFVSGASKHEWAAKGVPNSLIIAKPFAPAQIVVAISSLLITGNV